MLNIEKFADEIKEQIANGKEGMACAVQNLKNNGSYSCQLCTACEVDALNWLSQEYKEPLLSLKDKQYLEDTLKYYQDCVANLAIEYHVEADYSVRTLKIKLNIPQIVGGKTIKYVTWWLALPILDKSLLEKLDVAREYTLDELELYKEVEN